MQKLMLFVLAIALAHLWPSLAASSTTDRSWSPTAAPSSLSFGSVPVGNGSQLQSVKITNDTRTDRKLQSLSNSNSLEFTIAINACGKAIAAGSWCVMAVSFKPTYAGGRTGQLTLKYQNAAPLTIAMAGMGAAAPTSSTVMPAVVEDFTTGALSANWIVSNWSAPGGGVFRPENVTMHRGALGIKVSQTPQADGSIASIGGELQFAAPLGYGTYVWTMRAGSTSTSPSGPGSAVSGGISAVFSYINNSQTEIDFEIEGVYPNVLQLTNWSGIDDHYNSSFQVSQGVLDGGFHRYKYVWAPGVIDFYFDDVLVGTHRSSVPEAGAYAMINHWGTVDPYWGGLATPGVERWMWVTRFEYTPMQ